MTGAYSWMLSAFLDQEFGGGGGGDIQDGNRLPLL